MQSDIQNKPGLTNIYHCTIHKAGSQWFKAILSSPEIHKCSGLKHYHYQSHMDGGFDPRKINERSFTEPFPENTIISPIYIDYKNYTGIPKPEHYRSIFIIRDPRDLVVSHYYSKKFSHPVMGGIKTIREELIQLPTDEGLCLIIKNLEKDGTFAALRSWAGITGDNNLKVFRFEDLIGADSHAYFRDMFEFLQFHLTNKEFEKLLETHSFNALSRGRKPGQENQKSHYRKGVSGDWKNYFSTGVLQSFYESAGDLLDISGYAAGDKQ